MRKGLSLLKPYLHTIILNNNVAEKVKYLNVPTLVDEKTLKSDIAKGAVQFAELDKLICKEKEPQYILITTDSLEQGYLAVSYLAAGFNRKHGVCEDASWDAKLEKAETELEFWEENELQIPVIEEGSLRQSIGGGNDPFSMGNTFMQGNQNGFCAIQVPDLRLILRRIFCPRPKDNRLMKNTHVSDDFCLCAKVPDIMPSSPFLL